MRKMGNALSPTGLQLRQDNALLGLVLTLTISVTSLANFIGLEKDDLAQPFVRVDARRERRCVRNFQRHESFPLRLERSHVDDDPAARIGTLSYADGKDAAGDLEVFDGARQGERVRRDDANVGLHGNE